jgi:hypothetical protein
LVAAGVVQTLTYFLFPTVYAIFLVSYLSVIVWLVWRSVRLAWFSADATPLQRTLCRTALTCYVGGSVLWVFENTAGLYKLTRSFEGAQLQPLDFTCDLLFFQIFAFIFKLVPLRRGMRGARGGRRRVALAVGALARAVARWVGLVALFITT